MNLYFLELFKYSDSIFFVLWTKNIFGEETMNIIISKNSLQISIPRGSTILNQDLLNLRVEEETDIEISLV
eukprot:snap_masked-scaffold_81-processed-gene-0.17-mRNA-1 protein AED:1.00 eAED:1.00 QI:0/0/0/0/1/1/2/0/70